MSSDHQLIRINVPQAFFGAMLGVWYGYITRDVLQAADLKSPTAQAIAASIPNSSLGLSLFIFKSLYILSSLILIFLFIYHFVKFQKRMYKLPDEVDSGITFPALWPRMKKNVGRALLSLLFLWGFLIASFFLFHPTVSGWMLVFGGVQPFGWIVFETILVYDECSNPDS